MKPPSQRGAGGHPVDGLLLVDKPGGMTSHDVVYRIRRHFGFKKVGHGGTLDPMATGLLIILMGRGTKLSNWVMGSDKTYEGTMHFGVATDSQDLDGKILSEQDTGAVTEERVREEMRIRTGDLLQTPPMVSAVKKDGIPLYKLARKGKTVEREPRLIHVYAFEMLSYALPDARFRLTCTKGTYVRTLCHEIGQEIGCGAHLSVLRRTRSGPYSVNDAMRLEDILATDPAEVAERVIPPHKAGVHSQPIS